MPTAQLCMCYAELKLAKFKRKINKRAKSSRDKMKKLWNKYKIKIIFLFARDN